MIKKIDKTNSSVFLKETKSKELKIKQNKLKTNGSSDFEKVLNNEIRKIHTPSF